jgi:hypothetical protein
MKHGLELKAGNGNVVGRHDFFIGVAFCGSVSGVGTID